MTYPAPAPQRPKTRNSYTQARLRQETLWQIGLPIGLGLVLLIGFGALVISAETAAVRSPLADVSLMLLIVPVVIFGLVTLIVLGGSIYGLIYVLRELPFVFKRLQDYAALATLYVKEYTGRVARVVISIEASAASAQETVTQVRSLPGGKKK